MTRLSAYVRITAGDDGKPLGRSGLEPVAQNINGYVKAEDDRWAAPCWYVATHLGKSVLRMDAGSAHEARINWKVARSFLDLTGWTWTSDINANTRDALYGAPRRRDQPWGGF